ncbi:MAG: ATP-binding protein [Rhodoferax sp.]|nr:ATP-binding protein [Rhodoferax sp.]
MTPPSPNPLLRRRAEEQTQRTLPHLAEKAQELTPEAAQLLIHELRVHQIELEMQNEELRRTQIELDLLRARYFDLYDLAPVGYCSLSPDGLLVEANLQAATLLAIPRANLIRQRISQLILKTDQDIYYRCRRQLLDSGQAQRCELRLVRGDQSPVWVSLVIIGAQNPDGTTGIRMVVADISERKALDSALQEKNKELERARQVAETANLAKSEFLSNMSHELRTPLNAILGFAQLMALGAPSAAQQASLHQILRAGWYLLELIDDILDMALIESGKLVLLLEPTSLSEVLKDCEEMIQTQAQESHIRVNFLPPAHCVLLNADASRVRQVLINLLSNAIKYNTKDGAVEVSCSQRGAGRMRIQVRDTGSGLPAEAVDQLFQPFNRLGQGRGLTPGTGIGLVMSQRLVKLMGGDIGVESTVGVGSVFWFELNLAPG